MSSQRIVDRTVCPFCGIALLSLPAIDLLPEATPAADSLTLAALTHCLDWLTHSDHAHLMTRKWEEMEQHHVG